MRNLFFSLIILSLVSCSTVPGDSSSLPAPLPVKVVVVTMFEIGEDTGDKAGEFQLWRERRDLVEMPFHAWKNLYYNAEDDMLVMVTGIGTARSTASVMALGLDDRFDLSQAYWIVTGIAGIDPQDATVGSAVWSDYLVDGDLSHEIDAREKPEEWPFGYFARYTKKPFDEDKPNPTGEMYQLNSGLVEWAYQLTKDMEIKDDPSVQEIRDLYTDHPNAMGKPRVMKGDHIAALTFWHGTLMNDWANQWVNYWTEGKGNMVTSAMEDTGTYLSLSWLDKIDRVDVERMLVLRTGSNFTTQHPGNTAAENLLHENEGYAGLKVAVEAAYDVASKVADEITGNWEQYRDQLPNQEP